MTTPYEVPEGYNSPSISGQKMRGIWKITSGGERAQKVEQVQAPGFLGAFTIVRLEGQVDLEYRIEVWTVEDYAWLDALLQVFRQGMKARPPRGPTVYDVQDLSIKHLEATKFVVAKLTKIEHLGKGKYATLLGFGEWKKKLPIGGPPAARPKSEIEKQIERLNDENKALGKQLDAMKKK